MPHIITRLILTIIIYPSSLPVSQGQMQYLPDLQEEVNVPFPLS